jgi:hypothetical protein
MRFYKADISEFLKDGYFENNCSVCSEEYPAFTFITDETSGNVDIYEIIEYDYDRKEITELFVKTLSLTSYDDGLYLAAASADSTGLFRYKLDLPDTPYYSEPFRIISAPTRETYTLMNSGLLKVYDEDFIEFEKDGYFENNTVVYMSQYLTELYFDSELTVSSVTAEIRQYNEYDLNRKVYNDFKLKDLTLTYTGQIVYLDEPESLNNGIYRVKTTVNGTDTFYSELFCIGTFYDWILAEGVWNDLGVWIDSETWNDS